MGMTEEVWIISYLDTNNKDVRKKEWENAHII